MVVKESVLALALALVLVVVFALLQACSKSETKVYATTNDEFIVQYLDFLDKTTSESNRSIDHRLLNYLVRDDTSNSQDIFQDIEKALRVENFKVTSLEQIGLESIDDLKREYEVIEFLRMFSFTSSGIGVILQYSNNRYFDNDNPGELAFIRFDFDELQNGRLKVYNIRDTTKELTVPEFRLIGDISKLGFDNMRSDYNFDKVKLSHESFMIIEVLLKEGKIVDSYNVHRYFHSANNCSVYPFVDILNNLHPDTNMHYQY